MQDLTPFTSCEFGSGGVELPELPTALDNGQRTPRKLLSSAGRRISAWLNEGLNEFGPEPPPYAGSGPSPPKSLASIQYDHYELLAGYVDVLNWRPNPGSEPVSPRRFIGRRLIRRHIGQKLREASVPYGYLRESGQDPDMRDWCAQANESLERFSKTESRRSRFSRGAKAFAFSLPVAFFIANYFGFDYVREWAEKSSADETALHVAYITLGVMLLIAWLAWYFIVFFLTAGFSTKRQLFLGNASDVAFVRRKAANQGLRDGQNIYELETNLFSALGFPKKDEEQLDSTFLDLTAWALVAISVYVLIRRHWEFFLILLGIAFIVACLGEFLAYRRKYK
jgi:hypothetical protein